MRLRTLFGGGIALTLLLTTSALATLSSPSYRAPSPAERAGILAALPPAARLDCIRYVIRVSTVNSGYASLGFIFTRLGAPDCQGWNGETLMKRIRRGKWRPVESASDWQCDAAATPAVMKDLFSCSTYGASPRFHSPSGNIACIEHRTTKYQGDFIVCTTFNNGRAVFLAKKGLALLLESNAGYPFRRGRSPVLPYGREWLSNAFTCKSMLTGMRCTSNEERRYGFVIAREGVTLIP